MKIVRKKKTQKLSKSEQKLQNVVCLSRFYFFFSFIFLLFVSLSQRQICCSEVIFFCKFFCLTQLQMIFDVNLSRSLFYEHVFLVLQILVHIFTFTLNFNFKCFCSFKRVFMISKINKENLFIGVAVKTQKKIQVFFLL